MHVLVIIMFLCSVRASERWNYYRSYFEKHILVKMIHYDNGVAYNIKSACRRLALARPTARWPMGRLLGIRWWAAPTPGFQVHNNHWPAHEAANPKSYEHETHIGY